MSESLGFQGVELLGCVFQSASLVAEKAKGEIVLFLRALNQLEAQEREDLAIYARWHRKVLGRKAPGSLRTSRLRKKRVLAMARDAAALLPLTFVEDLATQNGPGSREIKNGPHNRRHYSRQGVL